MLLYDKPAYSLKRYNEMRKINRECFRKNPIKYCENQNEWKPNYEIKIDDEVYLLNNWFDGIGYIKKEYGVNIKYTISFTLLYFLGNKMPKNIDYVLCVKDLGVDDEILYSSHKCRFKTKIIDDAIQIEDLQGSIKEINKVLERFV